MCSGSFIDAIKLEGVQDIVGSKDGQQVALGSASGAIYILHNFTVGGILTLVMLNELPHPLPIFSQSDYLIQVVNTNSYS